MVITSTGFSGGGRGDGRDWRREKGCDGLRGQSETEARLLRRRVADGSGGSLGGWFSLGWTISEAVLSILSSPWADAADELVGVGSGGGDIDEAVLSRLSVGARCRGRGDSGTSEGACRGAEMGSPDAGAETPF